MVSFIKSTINSALFSIRDIAQERTSSPILICNRIGYGYVNNDWTTVFFNLAILLPTICFLMIAMTSSKPISG